MNAASTCRSRALSGRASAVACGVPLRVARAGELGGSIVQDKTVGPAGTSVTVADPGGALVALFTPAAG